MTKRNTTLQLCGEKEANVTPGAWAGSPAGCWAHHVPPPSPQGPRWSGSCVGRPGRLGTPRAGGKQHWPDSTAGPGTGGPFRGLFLGHLQARQMGREASRVFAGHVGLLQIRDLRNLTPTAGHPTKHANSKLWRKRLRS